MVILSPWNFFFFFFGYLYLNEAYVIMARKCINCEMLLFCTQEDIQGSASGK